MKNRIEYFVRPLDADTNGIIATDLIESGKIHGSITIISIKGEQASVFKVDINFLNRLRKSKVRLNLKYEIYKKINDAQAKKIEFSKKEFLKSRDILDKLEEIKDKKPVKKESRDSLRDFKNKAVKIKAGDKIIYLRSERSIMIFRGSEVLKFSGASKIGLPFGENSEKSINAFVNLFTAFFGFSYSRLENFDIVVFEILK